MQVAYYEDFAEIKKKIWSMLDKQWSAENKKSNGIGQKFKYDFSNDGKLDVSFVRLNLTRKEIDKYIEWVKRPQIGASGMIYAKYNEDNTFKSSVDKFFNQVDLAKWGEITGAKKGDIIFVLSGKKNKVRAQLSALRLFQFIKLFSV